MPASATRPLLALLAVCACFQISLCQGSSSSFPSNQLQQGQGSADCNPACVRGVCKQAVNSAALYCDCIGTSFEGVACNSSQSSASSFGGPAPSPADSCSPPCQHGGLCKQATNSAAFYCDCGRTGYKGATCSAPSLGSSSSANVSSNSSSAQNNASSPAAAISAVTASASACIPACQNKGTCKQAVNSDVYYCDCSHTAYTGPTCSAQNDYSPATGMAANLSACSPPCTHGAPCKQEVNSDVYYCDCHSLAFIGQDCSIPQSLSDKGGATSTNTYGAKAGSSAADDRIKWRGVLLIVLACLGGLALVGVLSMLLVRKVRSSRGNTFTRFREEDKFFSGLPDQRYGIEATQMNATRN